MAHTTETPDEWRAILARCADGLDLTTDYARYEFRNRLKHATRGVSLEQLQEMTAMVGGTIEPWMPSVAHQWITNNWVATATGRGTDLDIDAHTHCPLCRAPFRVEPARPETLGSAVQVCTDETCGHWQYDRRVNSAEYIA